MALSEKLWGRALTVAIVAVAGLGLTSCSLLNPGAVQRDDDGQVIEGNDDADAFAIEVGDCLNDASLSGTVTTVPIVPCSEPHDSEAYHAENLPDGDFPGDTEVETAADEVCYTAFEPFVGLPAEESIYRYSFYLPTAESWENLGDREVLCVIFDPAGQTTGSLADIAK